jgi:hypothetical protein
VTSASVSGLRIELTQSSIAAVTAGYWNVRWIVENTGANPLQLETVRLPHGQFRAAEKRFAPSLDLEPGSAAEFDTIVYCNEPTGLVTENAFVIFAASWHGQKWRIFARLRVVVNAQGEPQSVTELVTTQKVGFSGVPD